MVDSLKEFFKDVLPNKFESEKATNINLVTQMNISGTTGGNWYIIVKDKNLDIKEGTSPDAPDITVEIKDRDFLKLLNGKTTGEKLYLTGKLKFIGDLSDGMKLRELGII
ncbi:MAG: SCP2 sterol-binding domain-containing protein [Candidatus Helarchaeota archaeon]|nr:SCP2 sterol-binding domain-containing protein [Candidatus Helarchaeota archaeon]